MHRVVILAYDGVQSLDVCGPAEVFNGANLALDARDGTIRRNLDIWSAQEDPDLQISQNPRASDGRRYDVTVASLGGGTVATESPIALATQPLDTLPAVIDTLIVPGGLAVWHLRDDPGFIEPLRGLVARCRRLITVCSGAALAAATGVLDGHRVTTHWARAEQLAAAHPEIEVDPDPIYLHAGRGPGGGPDVWTSAGVTAGIDCSLAVVEVDHGTDIAQEIARWLVMYLRRPGGQSQFATPAWTRQAADGPIRAAQDLVVASPGGDHRIAVLAERVGMSHRHFVRRFTDEVAMSPARWIAAVRIDAARHELERTDDTVDVVARRCGFGTAETLRRSFHRHLGVGPDAYRARFSHQPSANHHANHADANQPADHPHPHPSPRPRQEDIA